MKSDFCHETVLDGAKGERYKITQLADLRSVNVIFPNIALPILFCIALLTKLYYCIHILRA